MMIFLGLSDICGYYSQLEKGFHQIGIECTLVNAFPSITYPRVTQPPLLGRIVETVAAWRVRSRRGSAKRRLYMVLQAFWMGWLFVWSLFTCRAYVFSGGISFFPPYDLWILKRLGKRVVIVFHGSDARPPYINGAVECEKGEDVARCIAEAAQVKRRLRAIEKNSDVIVNHVLSSHFHERRLVAWLNIGIPYDVSRSIPPPRRDRPECVIVHAPTRPGPKGSARIEAAIARLQAKGHRIVFTKLVGRPNAEVLDALRECDFVVDELFSDTTMASFATEAAAFAKPAIVGLYGFDELRRRTVPDMLPPGVVCDADRVEEAIEHLIVDVEHRRSLGEQARAFVERRWHPARVAERFYQLVESTEPDSWYFSPGDVLYLHGWGLSHGQARRRVADVILAGGTPALQLGDKPQLEQAFAEFGCTTAAC
jgi:hypothetical protein